jgi:hypothetical protein
MKYFSEDVLGESQNLKDNGFRFYYGVKNVLRGKETRSAQHCVP